VIHLLKSKFFLLARVYKGFQVIKHSNLLKTLTETLSLPPPGNPLPTDALARPFAVLLISGGKVQLKIVD